jgi:pheromone shutdown protein TraB
MEKVKIYQDGIPIGGEHGVKLVEECVKTGSQNFQIVSSLIRNGATLEKTEDAQLLKEEYEILKDIVSAKTANEREKLAEKHKKRLYELTEERDRYIAGRIEETLGEGMLGILFIGATHNISPYVSSEIDAFVCNYVERDIVEWMSK